MRLEVTSFRFMQSHYRVINKAYISIALLLCEPKCKPYFSEHYDRIVQGFQIAIKRQAIHLCPSFSFHWREGRRTRFLETEGIHATLLKDSSNSLSHTNIDGPSSHWFVSMHPVQVRSWSPAAETRAADGSI